MFCLPGAMGSPGFLDRKKMITHADNDKGIGHLRYYYSGWKSKIRNNIPWQCYYGICGLLQIETNLFV